MNEVMGDRTSILTLYFLYEAPALYVLRAVVGDGGGWVPGKG